MKISISRRSMVAFAAMLLCAVVLSIHLLNSQPKLPAAELFRKYVAEPIPASVTEIQVDQPREIGSCSYVFRFDVSPADFEQIAKSRPFREAEILLGDDGYLEWTWKDLPSSGHRGWIGSGFSIYDPRQRRPSWFDLQSWAHPQAYAYTREARHKHSQILIYNSALGKACFIIYIMDGGRPPFFWR